MTGGAEGDQDREDIAPVAVMDDQRFSGPAHAATMVVADQDSLAQAAEAAARAAAALVASPTPPPAKESQTPAGAAERDLRVEGHRLLGLSLQQPRDGGWMDVEEACSSGGCFPAFGNHLTNLGLLLRGELGGATADAALLPGGIDSGLSAFPQHGALELREGSHHLHHHAACRSGCVDGFGQAAESGSGFPELLHDGEQVAQRARQAIQLPDHDHIPGAELMEEPEELGAVPTTAGSLLAKDALAASGFERGDLSGGVLLIGGNASVTKQHCVMVLQNTLILQ